MDTYAADIKSRSYKLTKMDTILSFTNGRLVFFYENTNPCGKFMPGDKLKEGFFRTLVKFPWLLGVIKQTSNGLLEVVVDTDNLNIPVYRETQSDVHFRDIKAADYNPRVWPKNVLPVGKYPCLAKGEKVIKLASVHVVRLMDNSGIIISANHSHAVADVTSCLAFLNHWANETRALITGSTLEEVDYHLNPDLVTKRLPGERTPIDETTQKMLSTSSWPIDWVMGLSSNTRGKLLKLQGEKYPVTGHLFRISHLKLDALRNQVLECLPPGARLSENDILAAVTYKIHGHAVLEAARSKQGWLSKRMNYRAITSGEHCLSFPCNVRPRLGLTDMNCCGNCLIMMFVTNSMEHAQEPITAQSVAQIASQIRSAASRISPPYISQYRDTVESPDTRLGFLLAGVMRYKAWTATTNIKQAEMYSADFGNGVQAFSTMPLDSGQSLFTFMSSPAPSKDTLVNITESPVVMDGILNNEFWKDLATLVY